MTIENNHNTSEQKNNHIENDKKKVMPNISELENRLDADMKVDEQVVKQVEGLGGTKEVLMSKLAGVKEKIKWVGEKIRANARKLVLFTGLGLATFGAVKFAETKEHHKALTVENSSELMAKERKGAYVPGKSEWLAEHVTPVGYGFVFDKVELDMLQTEEGKEHMKDRYDSWYLYLGLEQKNGTFEVSPYKPSSGKDTSMVYYRMPKKEGFFLRHGLMVLDKKGKEKIVLTDARRARPADYISQGELDDAADIKPGDNVSELKEKHGLDPVLDSISSYAPVDYYGTMGSYTIAKGHDEKGSYLSYYDKWDLEPGVFGGKEASKVTGVGKPFEIYGRIYYDPKTGEPINIGK